MTTAKEQALAGAEAALREAAEKAEEAKCFFLQAREWGSEGDVRKMASACDEFSQNLLELANKTSTCTLSGEDTGVCAGCGDAGVGSAQFCSCCLKGWA